MACRLSLDTASGSMSPSRCCHCLGRSLSPSVLSYLQSDMSYLSSHDTPVITHVRTAIIHVIPVITHIIPVITRHTCITRHSCHCITMTLTLFIGFVSLLLVITCDLKHDLTNSKHRHIDAKKERSVTFKICQNKFPAGVLPLTPLGSSQCSPDP